MARVQLPKGGFLLAAEIEHQGTAGGKPAPGRRICWAGHISFQDDPFSFRPDFWNRDGREQGPGIRMRGSFVQNMLICHLHKFSQVHNGHTVTDITDHAQVMGNKQVG